ncbi:cilia- and flagella-associated protein 53-like [Biomphalaria glabrata]|uniref:Cilia- and flagella-associated protein 53 n=1 Tax=Biomphalaria glabrata TaxID=6526 RepID=A0A9U8EBR9_BIOGL|nr:cilia- and flagella-associated protein 53-like [Biomphalaria glabrata]KAI8789300.1 cilia- and flagella-associated protein 53 [Biomphalaria glabrata]
MMVSKHIPRTREYRGIQPNSVAIKAKMPSKRPPDWLVMKNRETEERIKALQFEVKDQHMRNIRTDFETSGDKKFLQLNIRSRIQSLTKANEYNLECRREKLRNLFELEEANYLKEMDEQQETVIERQAKMRERAKFLKDKREAERLAFVQEKYDQQFKAQCEELRSTLSKRHQDQVCLERLEQLRHKDEIAQEEKAISDMYDKLWEQDMLEKAAREEREAKDLQERNRGMVDVLRKQMAALEAQKEEANRLKEEEAQLMKEQQAMWKMEDEIAHQEKLRKQQATRDMLDHSLAFKARKKAKEEQEQLAFDLKILEQLIEESRNEALETMQRKKELREEDQRFRSYLKQLMEDEKAREKELEKLIQNEVEAAWEKRIDQWRKERVARKLLLEDVMAGRAKQIQERLQENQRQQLEAAREKEELQQKIAENQRLEAEQTLKHKQAYINHQNDLISQIEYNSKLREEERAYELDEYLKAQQAEREYQTRIKQVLDNPTHDKLHPMRRAMLNQAQNQTLF